jgi:muramoyltetrapeptide carboxypeptidase
MMRAEESLVKPPVLRKGDCVGLVAPSSPFPYDALQDGIRFLRDEGFLIKHLPALAARRQGFLAGGDQERADELQGMFEDPEVNAVFAVRGGYGAQRILDRLDADRIRCNPKIFLGYSDATCLLTFFLQAVRLVCFHGPFVNEMGSLSGRTRRCLIGLLTTEDPLGPIPVGDIRWIRRGSARGPIVGGNLSLLCSTLGTAWELETAGRILFLEDRGEKPYRVDRMLTHLRQAGKLSSIAGLLFGEFQVEQNEERGGNDTEVMEEVLRDNTKDLGVPVASGLPLGHGRHNVPVPLGVLAEIDGSEDRVSILEPAVRPRE